MHYTIIIILLVLSTVSIWLIPSFKYSAIDRRLWIAVWALKLAAMMSVFALYQYQYDDRSKSDVFRYYDDGVILNQLAKEHPQAFIQLMSGPVDSDPIFLEYLSETNNLDQNEQSILMGSNDFIIKLHALLHFIPYADYHSHAIIFNYLSLLGILMMYITLLQYNTDKKYTILALLVLLPSLLLWASAPLKESLLLFGIGALLRGVQLLLSKRKKVIAYIVFFIGAVVVWNVRSFYALVLIPFIILFYYNQINPRKIVLNYAILILIGITVFLEAGVINEKYDFKSMLVQKNQQFVSLAENEAAGSRLANPRLDESPLSFVKATPHAITNSLFRPFPWNAKGGLYWLMILENLVWIGFSTLTLLKSNAHIKHKNLFYLLLCSGLAILLINGYTVPILGALARYRSIGLLLIMLALANLDFEEEKLLYRKYKK